VTSESESSLVVFKFIRVTVTHRTRMYARHVNLNPGPIKCQAADFHHLLCAFFARAIRVAPVTVALWGDWQAVRG
jgi:hypothetical protein